MIRLIRALLIRMIFGKVTTVEATVLNSIDPKFETLIVISKDGIFTLGAIRVNSLTLVGDVSVSMSQPYASAFELVAKS